MKPDDLNRIAADLVLLCIKRNDLAETEVIFTFTAKRTAEGANISKVSLETKRTPAR